MSWPLVGREAELARASELLEVGRGFALLGTAGVGKSRLLQEALDKAEREGKASLRTYATEATRSVPFAPFVDLLPTAQTQDRFQLYRMVLEVLESGPPDGSPIVAVDDSHLLDEGSLALLTTIATSDSSTLAVTARTDDPMPPGLTSLWKDQWLERIDLYPLATEDVRNITNEVLGNVEPRLEEELWRLTQGNPLLLREVIEGSRDSNIRRDEEGVWRLDGELAATARLADLVDERLANLPEEFRDTLELIAIGAPVPLSVIAEATNPRFMTYLEDQHLVAVTEQDGHLIVSPSHPLYGEVLVARLGGTHKREIQRRLAAAATSAGLPLPVDALRAAIWQRDSGVVDDPALALRGATVALSRHDAPLAEELVRPVLGKSKAGQPSAVLGLALSYQRRYEEAEKVLGSAEPGDAESNAAIASARAQNLAFGLGRVSEAVRILSETSANIEDAALRARLDSERGLIAAIPGDFTETFSASLAALDNPAASTASRASASVSLTLAQAMTADCDGLFAHVEEGLEAARQSRVELPLAQDQILIMKANALLAAGQITDALSTARERYDEVGGAGVMKATWLGQMSLALDLAGRLVEAREALDRALGLIAEFDPFRLETQIAGVLALVAGQLGDPNPGLDLREILLPSPEPRIGIWLERGRSWSMAAAGDLEGAAHLAAEAGRNALGGQHVSWGAWVLHDAVRLGRPDLVVEPLQEAAHGSKGAHLIENMSHHAEALAACSTDRLSETALRFGEFGCLLLAAEASAQCSHLLTQGDKAQGASRETLLSMRWESQCQSPVTPALAHRPQLVSPREVEIALAAASGSSSPDIASSHFISARTVDNHLASIYRKLGIGGREELAELLSVAPADGSE